MLNDSLQEPTLPNLNSILEWLASAGGRIGVEQASGLQHQLRALRAMPLPTIQRLRFLDLFYEYATRITVGQIPALHESTLPVSHGIRQLVRTTQDLLELLAQDYLNTLTESVGPAPAPLVALRRSLQCLAWHLSIGYLAAAPLGMGIWQQFHFAYRAARRLELDKVTSLEDDTPLDQAYLAQLLLSVVQPASFTARELEFIYEYIGQCAQAIELWEALPSGRSGIFWIDPDRDAAPHALARRAPPPETHVFYFACDRIAQSAAEQLAALENGTTAAQLGLPTFAETHPGQGVLKRLSAFWGQPAKRKFPRRRQAYRADLCIGLQGVWELLQEQGAPPAASEWMITNESPDGYALMHVSGAIGQLQVGHIVALHQRRDDNVAEPWQICMVRWALSENPEHVELGLQVLSGKGIPARLAWPRDADRSHTAALLLPAAPPLRPAPALAVASGDIPDPSQKLILLVERDNFAVLELRARHLEDQTSSIEVFTVEPDERP